MFSDIFAKDDATKMVNDEVSCNKYKYNSCPKEIIDFLNQVYQQEIKNVDPGRAFYPASSLSDFAEKSRGNGIKEAMYHFILVLFIGILGVIGVYDLVKTGTLMLNGKPDLPITAIISFLLIIILSSFSYLHFYWYGRVVGMRLGTSSAEVVKATWPIFKRWYFSFFAIWTAATLFVINMPKIVFHFLKIFGEELKDHEPVYRAILGRGYSEYFSLLHSLSDAKIMTFVIIIDAFFALSILLSLLFSYKGFQSGKKEQIKNNEEEKVIEKDKMDYVFDRTLKELKDF